MGSLHPLYYSAANLLLFDLCHQMAQAKNSSLIAYDLGSHMTDSVSDT